MSVRRFLKGIGLLVPSCATIVKSCAIVGVNSGMLLAAYREGKRSEEVYKKMSPEEQKKIYDRCPLQKRGYGVDFFAAIKERTDTLTPDSEPPRVPYKYKK